MKNNNKNSSSKLVLSNEIDFVELVSAHEPKDEIEGSDVVYYCKSCKEVVETEMKKNTIHCSKCKKKSLSYGTERSVNNFYHIKS